jgi:hypothetical protein
MHKSMQARRFQTLHSVNADSLQNMKRIGNTESNKTYNPRNIKAQMPIDVDEVDSAMERFIRQKYEQRAFMNDSRPGTRSNTGSSSSVEDRPPPLPPKPTKRFGFGIQKSTPLPPRNGTPPVSPGMGSFNEQGNSPPRVNKASRVFGSNVNQSGDGLDSKLATLRDMGFPDDKRNSTVLKGLNGNLDKAVEALIRLGEQNSGRSRGNTPTPPAKLDMNGLMLKKAQTMPPPTASTNPFDALDATAPLPPLPNQSQTYGGSMTQPTSPAGSYNPFLQQMQASQHQQHPFAPQQQQQQQQQQFAHQTNPFGQPQPQQSLEQSFQGLGLSNQQSQQPLFPNRTGDYSQQVQAPFAQTNPFQQSFTPPPMPQMPPQYGSFYQSQPQQQQQYQSLSSPTSPGNPFLKSARSQMFPPSNTSSNPFGQFTAQQQPQQSQQQQQQQYTQQNQQHSSNPYMMQQQSQPQPTQVPDYFQTQQPTYQQSQQQLPAYQQPQQQPQQQQQQQQQQQPTYQQPQGAFNKNSIMALYDYPHLAPQRQEQSQTPPAASPAPPSAPALPTSGQMNPFASAQAPQQPPSAIPPQLQGGRHVSHESVDFAGLTGGRHSPDAFAGLSSSFRRP